MERCSCFYFLARRGSLNPQDDFSLSPEFLEPVAFALLGREEVDDHFAEIYQYPAARRVALHARGFAAVLLVPDFVQRFSQRIQLALAGPRADDEVIGENRMPLYIEEDDAFRFLIFERVN